MYSIQILLRACKTTIIAGNFRYLWLCSLLNVWRQANVIISLCWLHNPSRSFVDSLKVGKGRRNRRGGWCGGEGAARRGLGYFDVNNYGVCYSSVANLSFVEKQGEESNLLEAQSPVVQTALTKWTLSSVSTPLSAGWTRRGSRRTRYRNLTVS